MKKALALVLALVLALSMAVSAFALVLVPMDDQTPAPAKRTPVKVIDFVDTYLHVYHGGKYYVALEDEPWEDVKVTANGCVSAKLIDFDPETMVILENVGTDENPVWVDCVEWAVTRKGEVMENSIGITYDEAKEKAANLNKYGDPAYPDDKDGKVTYYGITCITNVFVIEIVVEDNYTAHFDEGDVQVEATLDDVPYAGEVKVVNDVIIFEYEEVKWTAANYKADPEKSAALEVETDGYSDWYTDEHGYSHELFDYEVDVNRAWPGAAVVSTTAFRAIEGKNLYVKAWSGFWGAFDEQDEGVALNVTLKEIAAGQKGVNFLAYVDSTWVDEDKDNKFEIDKENLTSLDFGFYGNQVIKGEFVIELETGLNWYELRELFGKKVEEEDIIPYYLVDENGKVVGGKEIDYMTANVKEEAKFEIKGANEALGQYSIVLEVPSSEVEGESNPNTGAESVVGVVAALAVVSVATAAAVSLKK